MGAVQRLAGSPHTLHVKRSLREANDLQLHGDLRRALHGMTNHLHLLRDHGNIGDRNGDEPTRDTTAEGARRHQGQERRRADEGQHHRRDRTQQSFLFFFTIAYLAELPGGHPGKRYEGIGVLNSLSPSVPNSHSL